MGQLVRASSRGADPVGQHLPVEAAADGPRREAGGDQAQARLARLIGPDHTHHLSRLDDQVQRLEDGSVRPGVAVRHRAQTQAHGRKPS